MNETRWQYYGTPGTTTGNLSVTWDTSVLSTQTVNIELWGYEETGEASPGLVGGLEPRVYEEGRAGMRAPG